MKNVLVVFMGLWLVTGFSVEAKPAPGGNAPMGIEKNQCLGKVDEGNYRITKWDPDLKCDCTGMTCVTGALSETADCRLVGEEKEQCEICQTLDNKDYYWNPVAKRYRAYTDKCSVEEKKCNTVDPCGNGTRETSYGWPIVIEGLGDWKFYGDDRNPCGIKDSLQPSQKRSPALRASLEKAREFQRKGYEGALAVKIDGAKTLTEVQKQRLLEEIAKRPSSRIVVPPVTSCPPVKF